MIEAGSGGLRIEIRPLARTGGGRARLAAAAAVVLGAALYGTANSAAFRYENLEVDGAVITPREMVMPIIR